MRTCGPSEIMTCGAPEFLDLLYLAKTQKRCPGDLVLDWHNSAQAGTMLDWWVADHNGLGESAKAHIERINDRATAVLEIQQAGDIPPDAAAS